MLNILRTLAGASLALAAFVGTATAQTCSFASLKLGPVVELNGEDELNFDLAHGLLRVAAGQTTYRYDLNRGGTVELKETARFSNRPNPGKFAALTSLAGAPNDRLIPERLTSGGAMALPNGRPMSVSWLYAGNYILKVGSGDSAAYAQFAEDLRNGQYCGASIQNLDPSMRKRLHSQAVYFLFDEISSGRIADYAAWLKYKPVFDAFLTRKEIAEFLEVYSYRSTQIEGLEPTLAAMDPEKLWTFAWNQAAKLFNDKEATDFTDLSIFQRNGRLIYTLLGTQPMDGAAMNKFGFYHLQVGDGAVAEGAGSQEWRWRQSDREYSAQVKIQDPAPASGLGNARFPGSARNGLIVFDATVNKADLAELLKSYRSYYSDQGFSFGPQVSVPDAAALVTREIGGGDLDYLIRDGHSDGDDANVFVVYPAGFMIEGRRRGAGGDETVKIVYNRTKNPELKRIGYDSFVESLKQRASKKGDAPLVFVDGSCWGLEKAWFGLGHAQPPLMIEIAANAPVNFFENVDRNAMRRLVDAIRGGGSFAKLRGALGELAGYASRREDWFILPDDSLYPLNGRLLPIRKQMWVTEPGKPARPYVPDGYF